ncbi:Uncharacterised protein [Bordetella ansorpii]|uniref:Uncharacterized protein n=1 Tax=Bordetella ansorpii TaxID=288768 RepID=A0A157RLZ7_9BORD|nr:hypothetical protein [Bordetella ansorpii]SAI59021.1 Uncharacterised protein [Bordetella ansorpii]
MEKTAQQQFDDLLKNSHFFNDCINNSKQAAGFVAGQILGALIKDESEQVEKFKQLILHELQVDSGLGPSIDSAARLVLHGMHLGLQTMLHPDEQTLLLRIRAAERAQAALSTARPRRKSKIPEVR